VELSIVIPTLHEAENVRLLLPRLHHAARMFLAPDEYEILIMDACSTDDIARVVSEGGARLVTVPGGYGRALRKGFETAKGRYIITMDADLSHNPYIIPQLYSHREDAEMIIASRWIRSGHSTTEWTRTLLSRALNMAFGFALDLSIRDMSSGFRLYHRRIFDEVRTEKTNFVVLLEILLKTHMAGFRIKEIPFHYHPRKHGGSKARILRFGMEYLGFLFEGWRLRNSVECADYEDRAFSSRILFQRAWHRKRHEIIVNMVRDCESILDVGCGSSQMLNALPQSIGCDISMNKLRFKRAPFRALVRADASQLPFADASFEAVVLSEVLEHIPNPFTALDEAVRVTRPGGDIVIAVPEDKPWARLIFSVYRLLHPAGYGSRHRSHPTRSVIVTAMKERGCTLAARRGLYGIESVLHFLAPK